MRAQINSLSESYMAATPIAWLVAGPAAAQHHLTQFRRVRLSQDSATRPLSPPPPQRHVRVSRAPARCIEPPSVLPRGKVRWAVGFSPSADLVYADQDPVGLQAEISARYGIGTLQLRWEDWSCQMRRRTRFR